MAYVDNLEVLSGYLSSFLRDDKICDEKQLSSAKKLGFLNTEKLITSLCVQSQIDKSYASFVVYKSEILTGETSLHTEIICDVGNACCTTIDADDTNIYFHTFSHADVWKCLCENSNDITKRYVFFPIYFDTRFHKSSHAASLAFDIKNEKLYLLDPNGSLTFCNDIMAQANVPLVDFDIDTNIYMKLLLDAYLKQFNDINATNYEYVECKIWNPKQKVANRIIKESSIGSGHCVMISIMLCHLLSITGMDIKDIYCMIAELTDDELLYLVNAYTKGINQYLTELAESIKAEKEYEKTNKYVKCKPLNDVNKFFTNDTEKDVLYV